jgi:hypothetical protein
VGLEELEDPLRSLVDDEAAADLGVGVGRDDRLGPLALEPAPDAVDVEGRAGALALERRVAGLADELGDTEEPAEGLLVERQLRRRRASRSRRSGRTSAPAARA